MKLRSLGVATALTLIAAGLVVSGVSGVPAHAKGCLPPGVSGPCPPPTPPPRGCDTPCPPAGGGGGKGGIDAQSPPSKTIKGKIPTSGAAKTTNIQSQSSTGSHTKK